MNFIEKSLHTLEMQSKNVLDRALNRNLRLAVTGLSGAGKTAFITGIVQQLLAPDLKRLPLFEVIQEKRLIGIKRALQPDFEISSFDFDAAVNTLNAPIPNWPASTRSISEIRLAIKFKPNNGLLSKFQDSSTMYLDIVDYPGEWLLDLPMLKHDYLNWSLSQKERIQSFSHSKYYQPFINALEEIDLAAPANEEQLRFVSNIYKDMLTDLVRNLGFYLAQPGRMLLPGEMAGAPILEFFPLIHLNFNELQAIKLNQHHNSNFYILNKRYKQYNEKIVTPFFSDYFAKFDRQVVLIDCLTPLNKGKTQFDDMSLAINEILKSFHYGNNNLLSRLFAPQMDKLLFAASKIDHVTKDQQPNVLMLLDNLIKESKNSIKYEGCDVKTMAISSICSTTNIQVKDKNNIVQAIKGVSLDERKPVVIFPGEVPKQLPNADFWEKQGFDFINFAPSLAKLEHIRLDHVLNYLLADRLK